MGNVILSILFRKEEKLDMKTGMLRVLLISGLLLLPVSAHAQAPSKEEGSPGVKADIRETARTAGEGIKTGSREMISGFKRAGKKTAAAAKDVGKSSKEGLGKAGAQMKEDMKGLKNGQLPEDR